ncbi:hypothetical protein REPUB_Repub15cG0010700 [Reevesia pubescens]
MVSTCWVVYFSLEAVLVGLFGWFYRYPLGRVIGGTVYPGLTLTAGTIWCELGYGASATVYRAIYLPFNDVVAVTCLDLDRCNSNMENQRLPFHAGLEQEQELPRKSLSKDEKARKLVLQHWLDVIDYAKWLHYDSRQPFFYWLDIGEGKEVDLEKCPRSKLQQ